MNFNYLMKLKIKLFIGFTIKSFNKIIHQIKNKIQNRYIKSNFKRMI